MGVRGCGGCCSLFRRWGEHYAIRSPWWIASLCILSSFKFLPFHGLYTIPKSRTLGSIVGIIKVIVPGARLRLGLGLHDSWRVYIYTTEYPVYSNPGIL